MCSFSGATCTSRVRHNADYVPYEKIRFDLLRQRVASLTLNCNGDFAIRAYVTAVFAAFRISAIEFQHKCQQQTKVWVLYGI